VLGSKKQEEVVLREGKRENSSEEAGRWPRLDDYGIGENRNLFCTGINHIFHISLSTKQEIIENRLGLCFNDAKWDGSRTRGSRKERKKLPPPGGNSKEGR